MTRREFRIAETGETIRDETAADDAFVWGYDVHYREYGPHDRDPRPVAGLRHGGAGRRRRRLTRRSRVPASDVATPTAGDSTAIPSAFPLPPSAAGR